MKNLFFLFALLLMLVSCNNQETYLIMRGDDMGFCKTANQASIDAYKNGIMTSIEVIVPGPDFYKAAEMLRANPGLDVGVHLCLNAEWDNHKWGPLTNATSFVDSNGYFFNTTEALFAADINETELKNELKAQIDTALKYIPHLSHLSSHMFWPNQDKRLDKVFKELSKEYKLPVGFNFAETDSFWGSPAEQKHSDLISYLENIKPGVNIFVMHPGYNSGDMLAIKGSGPDPNVNMAKHRQAVNNAITSEEAKEIIEKRNIKLVSYADVYKLAN